jgi:UDP-glucose 4-epimerase
MGKRVLITGGAGFIGSHLVDRLVHYGDAVTVLDDFSTGERANLSEAAANGDLRVVEGSILDREAVAAAMEDCDLVFHLAVQCVRRSLGKPLENHDANATGTLYVLEEARRRKVSRFVYCSSSEVYGNGRDALLNETTTVCEPVTVYGAAKLAGELYAKAYWRTYGLPTVVVRPFNAYGPREHDQGDIAEVIPRFVIRVLNGLPPVIFGDGSAGRDFTYVTETARGLAAAAGCDALIGREVNIAFGRMITVREVAHAITRMCQRPDLAPVFTGARPGDVHALHADTGLARSVLGFSTDIAFEQGLERYLAWFTRRHPDPAALLEDKVENWELPG